MKLITQTEHQSAVKREKQEMYVGSLDPFWRCSHAPVFHHCPLLTLTIVPVL